MSETKNAINDTAGKKIAISETKTSRRDFLRIGSAYGMTATLGAAALLGGSFSPIALAQTADRISNDRAKAKPKHTLKLGMVYSDAQHNIQRAGVWDFIRDLEARTNGAIQVEVINNGQLCSETTCVQKAMQGVIDIGVSSTQNGASVAPWLNALDFPYMFQTPAQIYDFFYNPESERVFRKIYRERHNMEMLFSTAELRGVMLGSNFAGKPAITELEQLKQARIRATETQFGQVALRLLGMNPVPVAWTETLDALRSGLVDGMETWPGAAAAFNMMPAIVKIVRLNFIPGTEHTAIRSQTFDKLDGSLQDALLESAYLTQQNIMYGFATARYAIIGDEENSGPNTMVGRAGAELNILSPEVLAQAEEVAYPTKPDYASLHNRLNKMAGFDAYETIKGVARRLPANAGVLDVVPRRWWQSA